MSSSAPAVRPRPMGGFSQGFGNFSDEHLDEGAMQKAMAQKSLQQQQTNLNPQSGKSGTNPLAPPTATEQAKPREVGTLKDELITRPVADIWKGVKSLFDINAILGIGPTDTPEQQANKQQMHQRYQQLTTDEKQEAEKQFNKRMREEKQAREEEAQKEQQKKQQERASLAVPKSTQKGPIGPASGGSKKSNATAMLEQDRKTLGNAGKKF